MSKTGKIKIEGVEGLLKFLSNLCEKNRDLIKSLHVKTKKHAVFTIEDPNDEEELEAGKGSTESTNEQSSNKRFHFGV